MNQTKMIEEACKRRVEARQVARDRYFTEIERIENRFIADCKTASEVGQSMVSGLDQLETEIRRLTLDNIGSAGNA